MKPTRHRRALLLASLLVWSLPAVPVSKAAGPEPLRVAIAGLVHGHVDGFFANSAHRSEIRLVGISDPDRSLFARYATKFGLASNLYYVDLEEMLVSTKPQAVLIYSSTFDHR